MAVKSVTVMHHSCALTLIFVFTTMKTQDEDRQAPSGETKEKFRLSLDERTGGFRISKKEEKVRKTRFDDAWYYLGFVGEIGYAIALPVVAGALLGKYIDQKWSSYPKATLSLLFTGSMFSMIGFIRTIMELMHRKSRN